MNPFFTIAAAGFALWSAVFWFLFIRLGFHQRLPLLFKRWSSINQVLEEAARRHGDKVIIELETPLTWAHSERALDRTGSLDATRYWSAEDALICVKRLAGSLERLMPARGERVAIFKATEFDLYLFGIAALRSGAIAVPMNGEMDPSIATGYLASVAASVLVTDTGHWRALVRSGVPPCVRHVILVDAESHVEAGACPPSRSAPYREVHALRGLLAAGAALSPGRERELRPGPDDPHYVVHTSGTTGIPKGVLVTGTGMLHSLRAVAVFNLISRRDLVYLALPMNHQIVQLYLQAIFLLGVKTVVNTRFEGARVLQSLADRAATVFFGFPIAYIQLHEAGLETAFLPRMRVWGTTADASHEVFQRAAVRHGGFFRDLGVPVDGSIFVDGLGSSEVGIAALLRISTPWTRLYGRRVGRRAPMGPRIKVADAAGREVPAGVAGRFMIKGPHMLAGYWNAHDKLYGASQNGWWYTGDIMRRLPNGELVHLDREVDVIHTAKGPVYTLLVEEILHQHPAVMDVCVFSVAGADDCSRPAAVIALRGTHQRYPLPRLQQELQASLDEDTELAFIEVLSWAEFPLGVTGKTLKRRLRERFAVRHLPPMLAEPAGQAAVAGTAATQSAVRA